jgi:hypothetical protein
MSDEPVLHRASRVVSLHVEAAMRHVAPEGATVTVTATGQQVEGTSTLPLPLDPLLQNLGQRLGPWSRVIAAIIYDTKDGRPTRVSVGMRA